MRRGRDYTDAEFEPVGTKTATWRRPFALFGQLFGVFWARWKWAMLGLAVLYALTLYLGPKSPHEMAYPPLPDAPARTAH